MSEDNNPLKRQFMHQAPKQPRSGAGTTNKSGYDPTIGLDEDQSPRYFAIERGTRHVRRFKLYLKDGRIYSVPYAYLPLIDFDPGEALRLITRELDIVIMGRSLEVLCDYFNEEKVLWIKESGSGIDDDDAPVFIASIKVHEKDGP